MTQTKADWLRSEIEKLEVEKEELEKLEKEHHEQFLADERRYKFNPSTSNLEVMKLHEGSTSAYTGGLRWGKIEAITSIITRYKEELKVLTGE